jgi:hypothetical protein
MDLRAQPNRRRLLDAARHVIEAHPDLPAELEALIWVNLRGRAHQVRGGHGVLQQLSSPADRTRPLKRALILTTWLTHHDPQLEVVLTNHILSYLEPLLTKTAPKTTRQSTEGQKQGTPESTEAP